MLTYLDSCILIYWVEGPAPFDARARAHLATLQAAGHRFAISDFTRLECLVKPLGLGDGALLLDYERMFLAPGVTVVPLSTPVFDRAAHIRGHHAYASSGKRYSAQDALHLAAAVQAGCTSFLTNDNRLAGFPDLTVEVLP
ncbi:type II toxin-antitoxin system VapC family toxin [Tautonia plasticadhaerens]|uniref:Ribonuclease VapC n=1 Tax=Tautonia plasticadhaerens TaxID=2527974 RepID=A0A518H4E3_9BACT|nr:PIN domain-containing protein [Tautonia plasticadhaerens]QDV35687.1 tRNA(fMet)-specific endonuclease VapC [Tautonia plasticadhaerens]